MTDNADPLSPPPLKNDCFALPPGVNWTPVDEALDLLKARLSVVVQAENLPVQDTLGRILAVPVVAPRSNPPHPNSAVDGYAVSGEAIGSGAQLLPLVDGRAAAGQPYPHEVPAGHAVRILTGASMPRGTDTVILQEDVSVGPGQIAFHGPLRVGANARAAGEDVTGGAEILPEGRKVSPADIAVMAATGVSQVAVRKPLRVAVISTGDELAEAGSEATNHQIYDANRPMLCALLTQMGYIPVDMGRVPDDREALCKTLDQAAAEADVVLTSGGASAGDEDHVSALLNETGSLNLWRIAIKPGRPLALAMWAGKPVFGLPGNPVAAMVCTLVFGAPAFGVLAGAGWARPEGIMLPAAFEKSKKQGRREYLRARLRDGLVEVYKSEGSGRIASLSWAEGLVELHDEALEVQHGTPVRFISFAEFGL